MLAMSELMTLDVSAESGRNVMRVKGEIDLSTAPVLEARLDELEDAGTVVLDLSDVTFIDSTGLRVILAADSRRREREQSFPIVAPDGPVLRLFQLTGVDVRLALFDSVDAAAAHE